MPSLLECLQSPRRREILRLVWEEERAAGDIHRSLGDVTFGAVSQQLRKLTDGGFVTCRRDGRHRYYLAQKDAVGPLRPWLESMWDDALERLRLKAEARTRAARRKRQRSQQ